MTTATPINIDTSLLQFQVPKSQKCGQKARVWDVEARILKEGLRLPGFNFDLDR